MPIRGIYKVYTEIERNLSKTLNTQTHETLRHTDTKAGERTNKKKKIEP